MILKTNVQIQGHEIRIQETIVYKEPCFFTWQGRQKKMFQVKPMASFLTVPIDRILSVKNVRA